MNAIPAIQSFEEFSAATEKLLEPAYRSKFGAIEWRDRKRPRKRLQFLVEDWLTSTGVSIIGGRSSSGKSFLALHLAMCVARGKDFFNYAVKRCGVVYQAGEGGMGLLDRMEAHAKHFKVEDTEEIPFTLIPQKIDIFTKEKRDVDDFIAEVNAISKKWEEQFGIAAGLVMIDTLKKAAPGIDEISGKDNAVVLDNVWRIERETGCHVCLVHHTNADGKKLRGHTSLRDDVDQVILIEHDKETGIREAVLEKIKDGEDGLKIRFTLVAVPVRSEPLEDGSTKDFTSCAVVTVTEKERLKKEQERQGFHVGPMEREILVRLFEAQKQYGKFIADGKDGPAEAIGLVVVDFSFYLDMCVEKMVEEPDKTKARNRASKNFTRNSRFLQSAGIIGTKRPYMWWNRKPVRGFPHTFPKGQMPDDPGTFSGQIPDMAESPGLQEALKFDGEVIP